MHVACTHGGHPLGEDGLPTAHTSSRRTLAEERPGKAQFGIHWMAFRKPFSSRRCSRHSDGSRHCHSNCTFLKLSRYRSRVEAVQKRGSLPVGKAHPADEAARRNGTSAWLGLPARAWWGVDFQTQDALGSPWGSSQPQTTTNQPEGAQRASPWVSFCSISCSLDMEGGAPYRMATHSQPGVKHGTQLSASDYHQMPRSQKARRGP